MICNNNDNKNVMVIVMVTGVMTLFFENFNFSKMKNYT